MSKIKVSKVENKKPKKVGKGSSVVKDHNASKIKASKGVKAVNMPDNYGVKKSR